MRIKYKVWDTLKKEWNHNVFVSCCGKVLIGDKHDDCRFVACIYTGLIDNKGTQVYCGDILAYPKGDFDRGLDGYDDRMEVYYEKKLARFALRFYSKWGGEGETGKYMHINDYLEKGAVVIGNVNSHPELAN